MAEINLFRTGEDFTDTLCAYYNGNAIYLTNEGRKDFQMALHPKEALRLIEELKEAAAATAMDILEAAKKDGDVKCHST